ncbi:hypothetical protein DSO57_1013663 [Entomophthora muscae]|uniref:Uncharacterized protein n=1 Tax=Entomophthora muscae TaxID=34485 RepID=A0ACC2U442_9FUNG|nr:hypothetical protein DSO57_1013663 [Entomophthora muscae]
MSEAVGTDFKVYPDLALESTSDYEMESVVDKVANESAFKNRPVESASRGMIIKTSIAKHHGLTLSPDHIFIAIIQGLSIHISLNPEKHKPVLGLTRLAEGQKECISFIGEDFRLGNSNNDWPGVFPEFQAKIGKKVDSDVFALLSTKFSISTPLSQPVA